MTFTVLVYDAEEGGYWAKVPELPGCVSQGETLEEVERNIKDAILTVLDYKARQGEYVATPRKWELAVTPEELPASA